MGNSLENFPDNNDVVWGDDSYMATSYGDTDAAFSNEFEDEELFDIDETVPTDGELDISVMPSSMADWVGRAACSGMPIDMFFPERGNTKKDARQVCKTRKTRQPCLDFALTDYESDGIWGGTSARTRRNFCCFGESFGCVSLSGLA